MLSDDEDDANGNDLGAVVVGGKAVDVDANRMDEKCSGKKRSASSSFVLGLK